MQRKSPRKQNKNTKLIVNTGEGFDFLLPINIKVETETLSETIGNDWVTTVACTGFYINDKPYNFPAESGYPILCQRTIHKDIALDLNGNVQEKIIDYMVADTHKRMKSWIDSPEGYIRKKEIIAVIARLWAKGEFGD